MPLLFPSPPFLAGEGERSEPRAPGETPPPPPVAPSRRAGDIDRGREKGESQAGDTAPSPALAAQSAPPTQPSQHKKKRSGGASHLSHEGSF